MISISIDEGVAAALSARATAQGLTVQAYLEAIARPRQAQRISPDDLDRFLDAEATTGHSPAGSFPRNELYSDHD